MPLFDTAAVNTTPHQAHPNTAKPSPPVAESSASQQAGDQVATVFQRSPNASGAAGIFGLGVRLSLVAAGWEAGSRAIAMVTWRRQTDPSEVAPQERRCGFGVLRLDALARTDIDDHRRAAAAGDWGTYTADVSRGPSRRD